MSLQADVIHDWMDLALDCYMHALKFSAFMGFGVTRLTGGKSVWIICM